MKLVQYNEYWVSTEGTDSLASKHQGISSKIATNIYIFMRDIMDVYRLSILKHFRMWIM